MTTARAIAEEIMRNTVRLRNRAIKASNSWFGESEHVLRDAGERIWDAAERDIQAYAEQVASERAEPLRQTIDALRLSNDVLRGQLAAAQAKGADPEDLAAAGVMLMGRRADHA